MPIPRESVDLFRVRSRCGLKDKTSYKSPSDGTIPGRLPSPSPLPMQAAVTPENVSEEKTLGVVDVVVPSSLESEKDTEEELNPIDDEDVFPDGGRGWIVLFGAFLMTTSASGLVNTWGVFQSLYETTVLPDSNPSAIAWIGSIQYALTLMPGLISGRLFDIGYLHLPVGIASAMLGLATILTAECKTFAQFFVVQGIVTGVASGFVFGPAMPIVSHWFKKRRSTGIGIVASGAASGGTILPIIVRELIPVVGRKWTMRILGFVLLAFLAAANLLIRRRLPPKRALGGLINPRAFRSAPYSIYVAGSFIAFLGIYTPLTFLSVFGVKSAHLSPGTSFYLLSVANGVSVVGRIGGGLLSDRWGPLNVLIPLNVVTAVATLVWPHCTGKGSLFSVAVVYGIASGAFTGLLAAPVAYLGDTADIGRRTGMMFSIVSIGSLIGPPISGAIYGRTGGFMEVGIYAGCTILFSAGILLATKVAALGSWRGKF